MIRVLLASDPGFLKVSIFNTSGVPSTSRPSLLLLQKSLLEGGVELGLWFF